MKKFKFSQITPQLNSGSPKKVSATSSIKTLNFNSLFKNKGASISMQQQWKTFNPQKKMLMRKKFKDSDGDRIPDKWDCQPFNSMRQDFMKKTTVPAYDHPEDYGYKTKVVRMTPDKYMELARKSHTTDSYTPEPQDEYNLNTVTRHRMKFADAKKKYPKMELNKQEYIDYTRRKEDKMDSIKAGLHLKKGVVAMPFIETKRGVPIGQEGRHRAIAAKEMGYRTIPVMMAETDKKYIEEQGDNVLGDYGRLPRDKKEKNERLKLLYDSVYDETSFKKPIKTKPFLKEVDIKTTVLGSYNPYGYAYSKGQPVIKVNTVDGDEEEIEKTMTHELAHAIQFEKNNKAKGHNKEFFEITKELGLERNHYALPNKAADKVYGLVDNNQKRVRHQDGELTPVFEYPAQANNYVDKRLGGSPAVNVVAFNNSSPGEFSEDEQEQLEEMYEFEDEDDEDVD